MEMGDGIYRGWELRYGRFEGKYWEKIEKLGLGRVKVKMKGNIKEGR